MANPLSYHETLIWIRGLTEEIGGIKYAGNRQGISEGISEQRAKSATIRSNEDKVQTLLHRVRDPSQKEELEKAFSNLKIVSEKKLHCLETMLSVSSLEDNCTRLSRDVDEKAVGMVRGIIQELSERQKGGRVQDTPAGGQVTGFVGTSAQDCIFGLRDNWEWIRTLVHCTDVHLNNASQYHQFYHEVEETEGWLGEDLRKIAERFEQHQWTSSEQDSKLLQQFLDETYVSLRQWEARTNRLWQTATSLVPVPRRTDASQEPIPAQILADYKTSQISVRKGEDVLLLDNSNPNLWRVRNGRGEESEVPALVVLIPGPDKQAIDAAVNMRLRLLASWTVALKKIGKQLICFMLDVFKPEYKPEQIKAISSIDHLNKEKMLDILGVVEDGLKRYWSDHEGFLQLQERILALRMALEESNDEPGSDEKLTENLILQVTALGEIIKIYQDMFKDWEHYKVSVEASRAPELMLIVDKWEQLQFVTRAFFAKFWKTSLPLTDLEKSLMKQRKFVLAGVPYEDDVRFEDAVDSVLSPRQKVATVYALESVMSDEKGKVFTTKIQTGPRTHLVHQADTRQVEEGEEEEGFSESWTVVSGRDDRGGPQTARVNPVTVLTEDNRVFRASFGPVETVSTDSRTERKPRDSTDSTGMVVWSDKVRVEDGRKEDGVFETIIRTDKINNGTGEENRRASKEGDLNQRTVFKAVVKADLGTTDGRKNNEDESWSEEGMYETFTNSHGRKQGEHEKTPQENYAGDKKVSRSEIHITNRGRSDEEDEEWSESGTYETVVRRDSKKSSTVFDIKSPDGKVCDTVTKHENTPPRDNQPVEDALGSRSEGKVYQVTRYSEDTVRDDRRPTVEIIDSGPQSVKIVNIKLSPAKNTNKKGPEEDESWSDEYTCETVVTRDQSRSNIPEDNVDKSRREQNQNKIVSTQSSHVKDLDKKLNEDESWSDEYTTETIVRTDQNRKKVEEDRTRRDQSEADNTHSSRVIDGDRKTGDEDEGWSDEYTSETIVRRDQGGSKTVGARLDTVQRETPKTVTAKSTNQSRANGAGNQPNEVDESWSDEYTCETVIKRDEHRNRNADETANKTTRDTSQGKGKPLGNDDREFEEEGMFESGVLSSRRAGGTAPAGDESWSEEGMEETTTRTTRKIPSTDDTTKADKEWSEHVTMETVVRKGKGSGDKDSEEEWKHWNEEESMETVVRKGKGPEGKDAEEGWRHWSEEGSSGSGAYETRTESESRDQSCKKPVKPIVLQPQCVETSVNEEGFEELREINVKGVKVGEHEGTSFGMATERKTAETEQLCSTEVEECKTFVIRSVVNPVNESKVSLKEAIESGIISTETGAYVNPVTHEVTPLPAAMSDGLIDVLYTTVKRSREKRSTIGIITVKTIKEIIRPYTIKSVMDTSRGSRVEREEAMKRGIIDPGRGVFYNRKTGKRMLITEAAEKGLMDIEYMGESPGDPEIISKVYAVRAVVDRRMKRTITFGEALRSGLIDKESGEYWDNLSGERMYVGDAIMRGFLKARVLQSSFGLSIDPENRMVIDKTDKLRKQVLQPLTIISAFKKALHGPPASM